MRSPATVVSKVAIVLGAVFSLAGCGRKATEADCQLIVDRNVELQMRALHVEDPVAIAKKQEELRNEMKPELSSCVGRRVTDAMMDCVRVAKSTEEISQCMR